MEEWLTIPEIARLLRTTENGARAWLSEQAGKGRNLRFKTEALFRADDVRLFGADRIPKSLFGEE